MCCTLSLYKVGAFCKCSHSHAHCPPSNPYLKSFFPMMIKTTTTKPSYMQLLDGCFPDHCFHTEQSWFVVFLCFPCLSVFFHLLTAELHSSLWDLLGRECPFVAHLRCGDKGVQGSRALPGRPLDFMGHRA